MRREAKLAWALGLSLVAFAPRVTAANELDAAVELYRTGQLDRALDAFVRLRARGGGDAEGLATVCLHLGILRTGTGDTEGAREAFECLLAIRPATPRPEALGPAVEATFDEARRAVGERPLSVVLRTPSSVEADRAFEIRAGATGGAARIVATTRLTLSSDVGRSVVDLHGPGPHQKQVRAPPSVARIEIHEALRDRSGWVLAEASAIVRVTSRGGGSSDRRPQGDGSDPAASAPITERWWFWTGIGALVAGGLAVGLVAATSGDGAEVGAPTIVGDL